MKKYRTKKNFDLGQVQGILKGRIIPKGAIGVIIAWDYETGGLYLKFEAPFKFTDSLGEEQIFTQLRYQPSELEEVI